MVPLASNNALAVLMAGGLSFNFFTISWYSLPSVGKLYQERGKRADWQAACHRHSQRMAECYWHSRGGVTCRPIPISNGMHSNGIAVTDTELACAELLLEEGIGLGDAAARRQQQQQQQQYTPQ
jgi:hypothetical protein